MSSINSKQNDRVSTEVEDVDDSSILAGVLLCFSGVIHSILNAAIDLNLFEIIAKSENSSMSASEIASKLPNPHPDMANRLERMLPSLVSYSLLTCSIRTTEDGNNERVYSLSSIGTYFASDKDGVSLAPFSSLIHRGYHNVWEDTKDAIIDADNNLHFKKVYGMLPYQYFETNKKVGHIFDQAMIQMGSTNMKRLLKIYGGFEGVSTLVDVGGGTGKILTQIISQYPSIKGINFDLSRVVQSAPCHSGIEHIGGDMFENVPEGDAIMLKRVLHNWSDEECIKILRNCHKALPQHGKVIVLDLIMPEVPNPSNIYKHASITDYIMFIVHGGKERTAREFEKLCMSSGFLKFHLALGDIFELPGVMEFYK